ncbi:hypothetical protein AB4455_23945 [Vibrio sp. 10N.261.46.E12]|uniref:Uncharacterized protein n=1 Tax=Vibrio splendidus 12E03 TaxID=1191305 RepID=A0A1E5FUE5_VIBSP|nr:MULTISPECIES: hypothetical protein [Vibrio]MCG9542880.1 hypothetical protein [Vibrio sp. Isolate33]OEF94105.1 hypothetical protein A142_18260 [Vibrio splendidus 12E03]OMO35134.1 hypothetical protein BH584_10185 [Vibrio sp. 10N.261.45.E1]PMJ24591.1 hypothetical protein BCU27_13095 [Vibrio sp. 10N.286.45.B6]PML92635.1 hypothetical protein BCT66_25165 [Vibrio sp. 10N.261.49.E11]
MKKFLASYIFILVPFVILLVTKLATSKPMEILTSTDWSVASFMMIAQSLGIIICDSNGSKNINSQGLLIFIGLTIILLILCGGVYAYSLINPESVFSYIQPVIFALSSFWLVIAYKTSDFLKKAARD